MMKRAKKNSLLLFYLLSIGLIGLSWKYGIVELKHQQARELHEGFDFYKNVQIAPGAKGELTQFHTYNPNVSIHYSLNGGDTFNEAGRNLDISTLTNPAILNEKISPRSKPVITDFPSLTSVVLFLENKTKNERSNCTSWTSLNGFSSHLPVISLNMANTSLFDEFEGIMVEGVHSWNNTDFYEAWWCSDANYTQRGIEWEKPVDFQYFEFGNMKYHATGGIRISGNATRGFPQKSFRINARNSYGSDKFEYPFFGSEGLKKYESLVLRMSGNDNTETMFADLLIHELAEGSDVLIQKGKPTVMFINGNYWGIYNLRERIDSYFVAKYSNSRKKEVTILENGKMELKHGSEEAQSEMLELVDMVKTKTKLNTVDLATIKASIDLNSFMDYIFFETYFANNDWPQNNSICYQIKGGKWKWILNDLDYSMAYPGAENVRKNMFEHLKKSGAAVAVIFNGLITNKDFKKKFKKRCKKNLSEFLSDNRVRAKFNALKKQYEQDIEWHIKRWGAISSQQVWEDNCEENYTFLINRRDVYLEQLEKI